MTVKGPKERMKKALRLGLCQLMVGTDKAANVSNARKAVREAASRGATLVALPEIWNGPYAVDKFLPYAEAVPEVGEPVSGEKNPTTLSISEMARENGVFLVGGSIPELASDGRIYNTCVVADPAGAIVAKHRKVHLFDVDIPGGIRFVESETLSPGSRLTTFDTPWCRVGVGICYDMRFPQLAMLMRDQGCKLLVYPGAFNLTTGPAHWELLQRARAVDNQLFVATVSPARNPDSSYKAWGHSTVVSPWGEILATTEHDAAIVVTDALDVEHCDRVRKQVPISVQARFDLYQPVKWIAAATPQDVGHDSSSAAAAKRSKVLHGHDATKL